MSGKNNRRAWSASEKMRIVLLGMEPGVEVSELCRREGINPTQYYSWKKQLMDGAEAVFGKRRGGKEALAAELDPHQKELNRLRAVITEITAENLELKKTL
jgi:transposase